MVKRWCRLRLGTFWFIFGLLICLILGSVGSLDSVRAEGSRDLNPEGAIDSRANIEWRTSFYGNFLKRRTLFKVYAQAGEVLLLGSSAVGVQDGDIRVYNSGRVDGQIGDETIPDTPDFSCAQQRTQTAFDQGRISSREQELAGPTTIIDASTGEPGTDVANGYTPCYYVAPEVGIYTVVFYGPEGDDSDEAMPPTGEVDLASEANFNEEQTTSVAAWDVTVRSSLTSTDDLSGRLFTRYLTRFTGNWPRPVNSSYFVLTTDGYIYRVDMRGLDANGFVVYANDVGFLDSDGSPLFHDVLSVPEGPTIEQDQLQNLQGGVSLAPPTHFIFFNQPSPEAIEELEVPLNPVIPEINSLTFEGVLGDNDTTVGAGGVFTFDTNIKGIYRLVISRDGQDFSPTNPQNRVLRDTHDAGTQTIVWDGLDNSGTPFPLGENYPAQLIVRGGEIHFPMLDAESSLRGGPSYTLLNPPGGECPSLDNGQPDCNIGFYDDRGYITANGTAVGTPGEVLPGTNPPNPPVSNLLTGFDTTTEQRSFGDGSRTGFGDKKGLDLWTFFPSEIETTLVDIFGPNLAIQKSDGGVTAKPGDNIVYTITYSNTSNVDATGVVITDVVPLHTTFNAQASQPTMWSCADDSPPETVCTTSVGTVTGGMSGLVTFGLTVDASVPDDVTQIINVVIIGDDGKNGPDPPDDNTSTEETPLERGTPTPTPDTTPGATPTDDATPTVTPTGSRTPAPAPSPTNTPSDGGRNDDGGDDDDDGGGGGDTSGGGGSNGGGGTTPSTSSGSPPLNVAQVAPTATLPVLFLPETGELESYALNNISNFLIVVVFSGSVLAFGYVLWRRRT